MRNAIQKTTGMWTAGLKAAAVAVAVVASASAAEARLTVCNRVSEPVKVALGVEEGDGWRSRGWWHIAPGECRALLDTDLKLLEYYLRAEPEEPGTGWGGDFPFCIDGKDFEIGGDTDCEARGHRTAGFFLLSTDGASSMTHNLTD